MQVDTEVLQDIAAKVLPIEPSPGAECSLHEHELEKLELLLVAAGLKNAGVLSSRNGSNSICTYSCGLGNEIVDP